MGEENQNNDPIITNGDQNQQGNHGKNGLAIAAMVLGIISLVLFFYWYIAFPCAVLAIIFAVISRKHGKNGMATAGLVTGIISIVVEIIMIFALTMLGLAIFNQASDIMNDNLNLTTYQHYDL